jgi:hypothetical protein
LLILVRAFFLSFFHCFSFVPGPKATDTKTRFLVEFARLRT